MSNRRLLRKDTSVYLIGNYSPQIVGSKLPSIKQVLSVLFFNLREVKLSVRESSKLVIEEVTIFWNKARIPTRDVQHCIKKVEVLYQTWAGLQKNWKRRTKSQLRKEENFVHEFDNLFDIAHQNALQYMNITEDKEFLINQRKKGREGYMYAIDTELAAREKRKEKRENSYALLKKRSQEETELLGHSGEAYAYGTQLSTIALGIPLAILFSTYFALPVLHPLKLISVNEYINLRFKSKKLQMVISFISLMKFLTFNGVTLYASTIALSSASNLDTVTSIYLLGIVCTVYSAFGGIRGVIWSDIFQLIVILTGLTLVFLIGSAHNGGIMKTFYISYEGGRLDVLNMNPSPFVRHTFINTVIYGFVNYLYLYSSNQINIQRVCSVKSILQAKRVLTSNIFGMFVLYFLIFSGGLVAYASYVGCDPLTLGLITKSDEIMTFFVSDKLGFVPGFSGLFFATLVGGSLSTLSSAINACVALIWRDFCLRFSYFQMMSSGAATLTNKILSFVVGAIIIGLSILSSKAKSLIGITMTIAGTFQGPVLGIFLIGYFLPKCNIKGVWTGFLLSLAFSLWLSLGSLFYKRPPSLLPLSVDECDHLNITSAINNATFRDVLTTSNTITEPPEKSTLSIESFYQISTTLFGAISTSLCILLAVVASFLTGNQNIGETSPEYITPCLRKYYWSVKDHKTFNEEEEIELNLNECKPEEIE